MLLDRLNSYLNNQPFRPPAADKAEAPASVLPKKAEGEDTPEELRISDRAGYLEYLSREFDVTALSTEQLNDLQSKLTDYGFIANSDLNGMRSLSLAKQMTESDETVNAVDLLNDFRSRFDELQIPYSIRRQVDKMSVVIQNMASARQLPS